MKTFSLIFNNIIVYDSFMMRFISLIFLLSDLITIIFPRLQSSRFSKLVHYTWFLTVIIVNLFLKQLLPIPVYVLFRRLKPKTLTRRPSCGYGSVIQYLPFLADENGRIVPSILVAPSKCFIKRSVPDLLRLKGSTVSKSQVEQLRSTLHYTVQCLERD